MHLDTPVPVFEVVLRGLVGQGEDEQVDGPRQEKELMRGVLAPVREDTMVADTTYVDFLADKVPNGDTGGGLLFLFGLSELLSEAFLRVLFAATHQQIVADIDT